MNMQAAVSTTFAMMRDNFVLFFAMAFAGTVTVEIVEALLFGVEYAAFGPMIDPETENPMAALTQGMLIWGVFTQILFSVLSAVLHLAAWDVMRGAHPAPSAYFTRSAGMIAPIFGLSFVVAIALAFGLVLLIVPGIYIWGMFAILVPVIVIEGRGWQALQRCMELSAGHRWAIAFGYIMLFFGLFMLSVFAGMIVGAVGGSLGAALIFNTVASALMLAIFAIFTTEIYAQMVKING